MGVALARRQQLIDERADRPVPPNDAFVVDDTADSVACDLPLDRFLMLLAPEFEATLVDGRTIDRADLESGRTTPADLGYGVGVRELLAVRSDEIGMIDDIAMIEATSDDGSSFWSVITISDRLIDNLSCFDDQYRCHVLFSELTDRRQSPDPPKAGHVLRAFAGALRASDPEAAIALLGPEFSVVDHRRIGLGTLDRNRYADSLRSATAMGSMAMSRARRIRDGGALTVTRNYYRNAGTGQEYVDTVSLLLTDDQHVTRIEHFGPDEWATALARFDELTAEGTQPSA